MRYRARVPTSTTKNGTNQAKTGPHEKTEDKQPISVLFDRVMVQISQTDGERRSRAGILIPAAVAVA